MKSGLRTVSRVFFQTLGNDALDQRVDALDDLGRTRRRRRLVHLDQLHHVVRDECLFAREYLVDHQPKCVDVAAGRDFLSADLLRSHVGRCSGTDAVFGDLSFYPGDTKIGDTGDAFLVDDDVCWFEIAM